MKKINKRLGQAIAEYLILTALIAVASIGIIQVISKNLRGKMNVVNGAILGNKVEYQGDNNTSKQIQTVDMGNFNETLKDAD